MLTRRWLPGCEGAEPVEELCNRYLYTSQFCTRNLYQNFAVAASFDMCRYYFRGRLQVLPLFQKHHNHAQLRSPQSELGMRTTWSGNLRSAFWTRLLSY